MFNDGIVFKRDKKINRDRVYDQATIQLNVRRYYTDQSGVIVDKNSIPDVLKTKTPFFLFGAFDESGGYAIGLKEFPLLGWEFLQSFCVGSDNYFSRFSGFNEVNEKLSIGEYVFMYVDNIPNVNYICWVVIGTKKQSYSSILKNSSSLLRTKLINYYADNEQQFYEEIGFIASNSVGFYKKDTISPSVYRSPNIKQKGFVPIPLNKLVSTYSGLASYLLFDSETLDFSIDVNY